MARVALLALGVGLALSACGLVQDFGPARGRDASFDAPRPDDASLDALGPDAPGLDASTAPDAATECTGQPDGTVCDGASGEPLRHICLMGACVLSLCGDGFVDAGFEECEATLDAACDAASCSFECTTHLDCPSTPPCEVATCESHRCIYATPSAPCSILDPGDGRCDGGRCVPATCGDGVVTEAIGEECDNGAESDACSGCRFGCRTNLDCSDREPCNGEEVCEEQLDAGVVYGRVCASASELPACAGTGCYIGRCVPDPVGAFSCETYLDERDGDGYATSSSCGVVGGDCDDGDPLVHPGAPEICNGEDDDCDGAADEDTIDVEWCLDADGDGFGNPATSTINCAQPTPQHVRDCRDCLDDPTDRLATLVHPGQTNFFTEPFFPRLGSPSFDYDCDGSELLQYPEVIDCGALAPILCERSVGWARTVPACGTTSYLARCRRVLICLRATSLETQACR